MWVTELGMWVTGYELSTRRGVGVYDILQPASQSNISFLWRVHFSANQIFHFSGGYIFQRTQPSVQSGNQARQIARDRRPERQHFERPAGQYLLFTFTKVPNRLYQESELCISQLQAPTSPRADPRGIFLR